MKKGTLAKGGPPWYWHGNLAMLIIFGLMLYPLFYTIYLTMVQYNLLSNVSQGFLGLKQYARVLTDDKFWHAMSVTLYFTVVSLGLQLILDAYGVIFKYSFSGTEAVKGINSGTLGSSYSCERAALELDIECQLWSTEQLLLQLGIIRQPIVWLGEPKLALNVIILADTWKMLPLFIIMLLAGLSTIQELIMKCQK